MLDFLIFLLFMLILKYFLNSVKVFVNTLLHCHPLFFIFSIDRVNNLREIQCMRRLSPHAHIVDLKEVIL